MTRRAGREPEPERPDQTEIILTVGRVKLFDAIGPIWIAILRCYSVPVDALSKGAR
jgi:hypothetical protein